MPYTITKSGLVVPEQPKPKKPPVIKDELVSMTLSDDKKLVKIVTRRTEDGNPVWINGTTTQFVHANADGTLDIFEWT